MIEALAQHPAVQPIGWSLIHSLWQGLLVAAALTAVLRLLPSGAARARYGAACIALSLLIALPVATFVYHANLPGEESTTAKTVAPLTLDPATSVAVQSPSPAASGAVGEAPAGTALSAPRIPSLLPWICLLWLVGITALGSYHLLGWHRLQQLRRRNARPAPQRWQRLAAQIARRLKIPQTVEFLESAAVEVPSVIGSLRPVLLVPPSAFAGMPPQQLEAILAHELAHVRRRDYLVNLLQVGVETLLFFHPATWWISRQVRIEREHCCDDLAVTVCGDRKLYTAALARLESLRPVVGRPSLAPSGAMAADGGFLVDRIRRLAGLPPLRSSRRRRHSWVATAATALVLLTLTFLPFLPKVADAAPHPSMLEEEEPAIISQDLGPVAFQGNWTLEPQKKNSFISLQLKDTLKPGWSASFWLHSSLLDTSQDRWTLRRDGGQFDFQVLKRSGKAMAGSYTFRPNQFFQREMAKLGYEVGAEEAFHLATLDLRLAFAQELHGMGYDDQPLKQLMAMHIHRATPEYIRSLNDRGYEDLSVEQLLQMRIHQVSLRFIDDLEAAGKGGLTPEELVQMSIHGVDMDFIAELARHGYTDLERELLVALRIHEVTPVFIEELAGLGYNRVPAKQLIALRIHEVTPGFIEELRGLGYPALKVEQLIQMRIHRVTPAFIQEVEAEEGALPTVEYLIQRKIHGHQAAAAAASPIAPFDAEAFLLRELKLIADLEKEIC